jgi:hypothetical protein
VVPITSLLVPTLVAAVGVFVVSSIVHMLLPYHKTDYAAVPSEDRLAEALRGLGVEQGEYLMPYPGPGGMKDPEFLRRVEVGPRALLTVMPNGMGSMGTLLAQWFVYCVVVEFFAAYVAGRALVPGADATNVFRFVGTIAFVGYVLAGWQSSIWWGRKWSTSIKNTFDGVLYAAVSGAVFVWLWPGA